MVKEPKLTTAQKKKLKEKLLEEKVGTDLISLPLNESDIQISEDVIQDLIDYDEYQEFIPSLHEEIPEVLPPEKKEKSRKTKKKEKSRKTKPTKTAKRVVVEQPEVDSPNIRRSARISKVNPKYT